MEPNFHDQEYLIIDELSYRFNQPQRGDIIVFRYPLDPQEYFIKRVIGLPGEKVEIKDGKVIIYNLDHPDGLTLDETYLPAGTVTEKNSVNGVTELGSDEYFVMGDNRDYSKDSRTFGPVKKSFFIGKVMFRGWPLNKIAVFKATTY